MNADQACAYMNMLAGDYEMELESSSEEESADEERDDEMQERDHSEELYDEDANSPASVDPTEVPPDPLPASPVPNLDMEFSGIDLFHSRVRFQPYMREETVKVVVVQRTPTVLRPARASVTARFHGGSSPVPVPDDTQARFNALRPTVEDLLLRVNNRPRATLYDDLHWMLGASAGFFQAVNATS